MRLLGLMSIPRPWRCQKDSILGKAVRALLPRYVVLLFFTLDTFLPPPFSSFQDMAWAFGCPFFSLTLIESYRGFFLLRDVSLLFLAIPSLRSPRYSIVDLSGMKVAQAPSDLSSCLAGSKAPAFTFPLFASAPTFLERMRVSLSGLVPAFFSVALRTGWISPYCPLSHTLIAPPFPFLMVKSRSFRARSPSGRLLHLWSSETPYTGKAFLVLLSLLRVRLSFFFFLS